MKLGKSDNFPFGLKIPLIQAPIGGASCPELAIAVADAGAMGGLSITWRTESETRHLVSQICESTSGAFLVNIVLTFGSRNLVPALQAGAKVITFSFGLPGELIAKCHAFGAIVGVQIGSVGGATAALDQGADFLIAQGYEAGGHLQSSTTLTELLPLVTEAAGGRPVFAAGGLADGLDLFGVMRLGAAGAMMGTRFVATTESMAHDAYKNRILDATSTVATHCFDGGWPDSIARVLRNQTFDQWENFGCPPPGSRPNEDESIATNQKGESVLRYSNQQPLSTHSGSVENMALYAGESCKNITTILPAKRLVEQLWGEYLQYVNAEMSST